MKLFEFCTVEDFGSEYYLNIGCTKWFNLLQFEFWLNLEPKRPILLVNILGESLFGFSISLWKFDFSFDFIAYRPRNLEYYCQ